MRKTTITTKSEWERLYEKLSLRPWDGTSFAPSTLYHYTGAAGVEGILSTQSLRATNFSFLNDPSEVQYGYKLVEDVLRKQQELYHGTSKDLLQAIESSLKDSVSEVYVCSFTQCRDDLSQWRAYGTAMAPRYCIGFDFGEMYDIKGVPEFEEVIYQEQDQRNLILDTVNMAARVAESFPSNVLEIAARAAGALAGLLPVLKSLAYFREEEWRFIRRVPAGDVSDVCFDVSRGVIRPYINFKLAQGETLPVVELLVLAPGRKETSLKAAEMLLRKAKIEGVDPEYSLVPFAE